jgi:Family of unknown function (DUF5670)
MYTIAAILLLGWVLGLLGTKTVGAALLVLLVVALVFFYFSLQRRLRTLI